MAIPLPAPLDATPLTQDERDFATAPMILHGRGGGWDDALAPWVRGELPRARLEHLRSGGNPNLACELDAVAYLMTASLEAPLGSEWTRIYLYVAFKAMRVYAQRFATVPGETWVRESEAPLSPYEQTMLDDLRGKIRAAQIKHFKPARSPARRIKRRETL